MTYVYEVSAPANNSYFCKDEWAWDAQSRPLSKTQLNKLVNHEFDQDFAEYQEDDNIISMIPKLVHNNDESKLDIVCTITTHKKITKTRQNQLIKNIRGQWSVLEQFPILNHCYVVPWDNDVKPTCRLISGEERRFVLTFCNENAQLSDAIDFPDQRSYSFKEAQEIIIQDIQDDMIILNEQLKRAKKLKESDIPITRLATTR